MKNSNWLILNLWTVCIILLPYDVSTTITLLVLLNFGIALTAVLSDLWWEYKVDTTTSKTMAKIISDIEDNLKTMNQSRSKEKL